jgi:hypothetical protein
MIDWLHLTDEQRRTSIAQAAVISGIAEKAIEKDWWVTITLKALFESPHAKFFIFKGGTSLSKGWKLIERFSEDIDIALDPIAFGREYKNNPSHTYVKTLKKEGCTFTSTILLDSLMAQFYRMGTPMKSIEITAETVPEKVPDRDPQTLYVKYKSLYPAHGYIADEVKIEFSVRSLKEPYATVRVQSILSESFPNIAYPESPLEVFATAPQKTLLEKAFLLHEKFLNINSEKIKIERLSRHLYDLVKLMNTEAGLKVVKDFEFYQRLLEHRKNYVRLGNVDYVTLNPSTLNFIPPDDVIEMFRQDYRSMQDAMIYGTSPDFDTIINNLKILTGRFRLINDDHLLENIIKDASLQIDKDASAESEGNTFSTVVTYIKDKTISYKVGFLCKKNKWSFESIEINQG